MTETPFLTRDDIVNVLKDVRLTMPGWTVTLVDDEFLGPHVRFTGTVPHRDLPGERVDLGINARVPPCQNKDQLLAWLLHRWVEIWIHEARETFLHDGTRISDPHA